MGVRHSSHNAFYNKRMTVLKEAKKACKEFQSVPYQKTFIPSYVSDVYDGDTLTAEIMFENAPFKFKLRVAGIDAPEIRSKNPFEREAAMVARDYVSDLVSNSYKSIILYKLDKYGGRYVGDLYVQNMLLSELLIKYNLAKTYDKTKQAWTDDEYKRIIEFGKNMKTVSKN